MSRHHHHHVYHRGNSNRISSDNEDINNQYSFGLVRSALFVLGIALFLFLTTYLAPVMIKMGMVFYTIALVILTAKSHGVLIGFYDLRFLPVRHDYPVFYNHASNPADAEGVPISDGASWYSGYDYYIDLKKSPNLATSIGKASEYVRAMPWFLKIRSSVFYFALIICFFLSEALPLETSMFESVFGEGSRLAFYTPYIILGIIEILIVVTLNVINNARHSKLRLLAKMIVEYNKDYAEAKPIIDSIQRIEAFNKYYNLCPSCGAEAGEKDTSCVTCGISLLIPVKVQVEEGEFHRVQEQETVNVVMKSLEREKAYAKKSIEKWYYDYCPKCKTLASETDTICKSCGNILVISNVSEVAEYNRHKLTTSTSGKIVTTASPKTPKNMKSHWYYNTCQRCSTEAGIDDKECPKCGKSLIIENMAFIPIDDRHQVKD